MCLSIVLIIRIAMKRYFSFLVLLLAFIYSFRIHKNLPVKCVYVCVCLCMYVCFVYQFLGKMYSDV